MRMKEKVYIDRLFADYEDTQEIRDFKEEIAGNLRERVKELASKGLGEEEAFDKAAAELGDITAIADDLGKRKRNEAIGQMYMKAKVPITKKTAAGLTIATGMLLMGAGLAALNYFIETSGMLLYYISVILIAGACGLYAYSGLTQESIASYPMKCIRALAYGIILFIGIMGEGIVMVSFFLGGMELAVALGIEFALVFPAVCALVFLVTTESDRKKPWVKAIAEHEMEIATRLRSDSIDMVRAAKFGVMSIGLWILAAAVFITIGVFYDWWYALLVFPFAIAFQVMMISTIFVKKSEIILH